VSRLGSEPFSHKLIMFCETPRCLANSRVLMFWAVRMDLITSETLVYIRDAAGLLWVIYLFCVTRHRIAPRPVIVKSHFSGKVKMITLVVMKPKKTPVSEWLDKHFLKWQMDSGGSKTLVEFAAYLGVSRDSLNNWINRGSKPEPKSVDILASKLDDPTIYELMGLPSPDPRLLAIIGHWGEAPDAAKDEALSVIRRSSEIKRSEADHKRVAPAQRK
jgi:hypothetical protein